MQKPREIAARVLRRRAGGVEFVENLLDQALAGAKLAAPDRGLCQELVFGCVRWQAALDHLIALKTGGREQRPGLQILLRLGLYQIFWLDRIPDHAAVNETVELAKRGGFGAQAGFVNAVLRGYLREADATRARLAELKATQPDVGWSHPGWLLERWRNRFGAENLTRLLAWNNTPPKTFARVNTLRTDAGKLLEQWRAEKVEYDFVRHDWLPENLSFELKSHPPLVSLESFRQGGFYLQDPSTLFAVRVLDPQPGDAILDLCAAPGGKTTFMAQQMNNAGRIVAHDISADRLQLIRENCARLGATCVDITSHLPPQTSPFDRVLVDAPCSNTGVLRRRVDLRWRLQPEEITRLGATQLELLRQAAAVVKPGGVLVYSTCSLEPEENAGVVQEFLAGQSGFHLETERELLPFADHMDGAYMAKLMRNA